MKLGRNVTVDDGGNYVFLTTTTLLNQIIIDNGWPTPQIARNVRIKIQKK